MLTTVMPMGCVFCSHNFDVANRHSHTSHASYCARETLLQSRGLNSKNIVLGTKIVPILCSAKYVVLPQIVLGPVNSFCRVWVPLDSFRVAYGDGFTVVSAR